MVQAVNNPLAMLKTQEIQVWSLGQEDPLEEEMATSILVWKDSDREAWWATVHGYWNDETIPI